MVVERFREVCSEITEKTAEEVLADPETVV